MNKKKASEVKIDRLIDATYKENCSGIPINIMDINRIFVEGRKALAEGRNLRETIVALVEAIRTDKGAATT